MAGLFDDVLKRYGEPALSLVSGAVAPAYAGWFGLLGGGADASKAVQEGMTYQPRSAAGQESMRQIGGLLGDVKKDFEQWPGMAPLFKSINNGVDDLGTRSPLLGAALQTLPAAAGLFLGPGSSFTRDVFANVGKGLLDFPLVNGKITLASMASKRPDIFNPPPKPQRPFHDDYPQGTGRPDGSAIPLDIDGKPLTAPYIAGRRVGGGVDEGLSRIDQDRIAESLGIGRHQTPRTGPDLRGDAGRYYSGSDPRIFVDQSLNSNTANLVFSHELGHGLEDLLGSNLDLTGVRKEASQVYSDLNSRFSVKPGKIGATPQNQGYAAPQVDRELAAEAFRAYMQDPNYIKTVAPNLAARVRKFVKENPNLNKVIQFNSAAGLGLLGLEAAGSDANGDVFPYTQPKVNE